MARVAIAVWLALAALLAAAAAASAHVCLLDLVTITGPHYHIFC